MSVLMMFSIKSRKWGLSSKYQAFTLQPLHHQYLSSSLIARLEKKKKVGPFSFIFFFLQRTLQTTFGTDTAREMFIC